MNNYLSQTGKEKVDPNRFNYRRTTRDYDIQQPNFMRHLEEGSASKTNLELAGKSGILSVLSKTRGWLTVTPGHPERKAPIDRK